MRHGIAHRSKFGCFSTTGTNLVPINYGDGPGQISLEHAPEPDLGMGRCAQARLPARNNGGGNGGQPGGFPKVAVGAAVVVSAVDVAAVADAAVWAISVAETRVNAII